MILQTDFPPDIRVEKEVKSLIKCGHHVHLVCKNVKRKESLSRVENFYIHRLIPFKGVLKKFNKIKMFPAPFNPAWSNLVRKVIINYSINVLHVHDLPLAPLAVSMGRKFCIPVIYDMHENYPEALKAWNKKGFEKIIKSPFIAKIVEKRVVRKADKLIVVIEEQKQRLEKSGIHSDKIIVLSNTVDTEKFVPKGKSQSIREELQSDFILTYVGGLDENRGLETLIKAFYLFLFYHHNAKLLIVGSGRKKENLINLTKKLKIILNVQFTDWIPFDMVPDYVMASDVCLIPQPVNGHSNTTIPHKLFQYMSMGKPVIVSDAKPLARIVRETKSGLVFNSNDEESLVKAIIKLYNDMEREKMGDNGKQAVLDKYNWSRTQNSLLDLYKRIL
ncbi:glycosyltransferase family 4 protein [candidate division KSB1 bacterium]|nr:glycosyltransferase family 4 protein [candidate division KSB1 bacterium]